MIVRKRSRATASSRAAPFSVSMKPSSAVSGVRNSWLTFATKSRRIWPICSRSVMSSKLTSTPVMPSPPTAAASTFHTVSRAGPVTR